MEVKKEKNINNSKANIKKIKSHYFIGLLFSFIKKLISLEIIKYNKNLKNILKINLNSYKEYSETLSSIEIEIRIKKNEYGKFINFKDNNEKNIHIFFDDEETEIEIKRNYLNIDERVNKVKIIIDYQVLSINDLFTKCKCIESLEFKKFYRNNITSFENMFSGCSNLKNIDIINCNTINIKNMSNMFYNCLSLKYLNFHNFNTSNVTDMSSMFYGCFSLKKINLSEFNTINVGYMNNMFKGCLSLEKLDISNFNTSNTLDMSGMFSECLSLKEINLANLNLEKVLDFFNKNKSFEFNCIKCSQYE